MAGEIEQSTGFSDALVILGAAGIVIPIFARFRITPVIGFILVGVAVGPFALGSMVAQHPWLYHVTITDRDSLDPFAEYGIVLLLFSIGLELSFTRLWAMRRLVFGLGVAELLVSAVVIGAGLLILGNSWQAGLVIGLALALSSTTLVLPISGTQSPVGKAALSMLLFEDIALVPIVFLTGALAPFAADQGWAPFLHTVLIGLAVVAAMLVIGKLFLPRMFASAARTKSPEVFLAASLLVVIVSSLATTLAGLSPIMGALLAGLLIAETEYHSEVEVITAPFKGLALGVFLITIGMGVDLTMLRDNLWQLLVAVVAVIVVKTVVTTLLLRMMGATRGTATETGLLMASPSETTLIVLSTATVAGLIHRDATHFWQIATAIGLTVTPLLAKAGHAIAKRIEKHDGPDITLATEHDAEIRAVLIGFGRIGRLVGEMLSTHGRRYLAVDANAQIVREAVQNGFPVLFGDVRRQAFLDRLGLDRAEALIVTMDEPVLAGQVIRKLRAAYPDLPIIARARDAAHAAQLYRYGATHAVPETLESALQLSEAVLVDLGVAMGPVIASIHEKRDEFREKIKHEGQLDELPKLKIGLRERPG